jgi:hypothetical protein
MATSDDKDDEAGAEREIIRFPQSRVRPPGGKAAFKLLGSSELAKKLGAPDRQTTGHWCSRCQGVWYGYPLEVACPVCGNRHG